MVPSHSSPSTTGQLATCLAASPPPFSPPRLQGRSLPPPLPPPPLTAMALPPTPHQPGPRSRNLRALQLGGCVAAREANRAREHSASLHYAGRQNRAEFLQGRAAACISRRGVYLSVYGYMCAPTNVRASRPAPLSSSRLLLRSCAKCSPPSPRPPCPPVSPALSLRLVKHGGPTNSITSLCLVP